MAILIEVQKLNKYFQVGESRLQVLKNIDLTIQEGDFVSVMGPSGSGKSTLINILGFLDSNFEGTYYFQGQSITDRSDRDISRLRNQMVGFVFQDFNLIDTMTVQENIQLPLIYGGYRSKEAKPLVEEALSWVGLASKIKSKPHELSGGQRQRVAIARALIHSPSFIIADEPTGSLDTKTSQTIMEILSQLHKEGATIIMVTHDPMLQKYANKHLVIIDGMIKEVGLGEAQDYIQTFRQMESDKVGEED